MLPNKAKSVIFKIYLAFLAALALSAASFSAYADDRGDALALLDKWTSFRWGDDNLTWVVHYTDEFAELWVKSEAARQRMTPVQEDAYRKSFTGELRTGDAAAILLSVHAFGQGPLSLAPLAKNISLIDQSGRRVSPIAFEKKLDGPLNGLTQGLVFFPKQQGGSFSVAVKGLRRDVETRFSFSDEAGGLIVTAAPSISSAPRMPARTDAPPKETIVKIPSAKPPRRPEPPKQPDRAQSSDIAALPEVFPPTKPAMPEASETAFPEATPEPPADALSPPETAPPQQQYRQSQVLDTYLRAWMDGDAGRMYSLLSSESQRRISRELFSREVMSDGFRRGLRGGYKVEWEDGAAKVIAARKILFMRTLDSKQINFVEENGSIRVSW
ncbi:MAG: hypothetical protein LBG29_06730 [Synergistaceae bacterium]|jgi:hypothetical protein|nr:hypothetical protein [Synergistaceae bacterium]